MQVMNEGGIYEKEKWLDKKGNPDYSFTGMYCLIFMGTGDT